MCLFKSVSLVFFHCPSMQRFVSKRSSSSVDLYSSSLDDMRAERAAIALSVGLSWPLDRRRRSVRRPGWQQHWERALQKHIFHHQELPHGVCLQRPVWWRPDRLHQHSLCRLSLSGSPIGSGTKRRKAQVDPISTCHTSGRHNDNGAGRSACAKSSGCAPGCSTGSTRTLATAGNAAHEQQRRSAGKVCCHPQA